MRVRVAALAGVAVVLVASGPLASSSPTPPRASSRLGTGVQAPQVTALRLPAPERAAPPRAVRPATEPLRRTPGPVLSRAARSAPSYPVRRGEAALAALDWPWRELVFDVRFEAHRGRFLGLTDASTRTITVYVKRGQSEGDLRTTIAHELGHALDAVTGTQEMRRGYRAVRGIDPDVPWYPCDRCEDLRSPAGDFAETFARWLVGPAYARRTLVPPPDAEQLEALDYFFRPLSARQE